MTHWWFKKNKTHLLTLISIKSCPYDKQQTTPKIKQWIGWIYLNDGKSILIFRFLQTFKIQYKTRWKNFDYSIKIM